jgi:pimeloyl-ACP methyl ester carboxylesterase
MELLAPSFRVLSADTLGAGRSSEWPQDRDVSLADEATYLEPVFAEAGSPFSLVGHSYGAAIALVTALSRPERVSCLALYEPTMFSLLREEDPAQPALVEISTVAGSAAAAVESNDLDGAAQGFIDYWMGPGSWAETPRTRRAAVAPAMRNVAGWAHALMNDPTPLSSFRALDIPVLYLVGERSPSSSRGVARLLERTLPRLEYIELKGLGHMAPLTHPHRVNPLIDRFLRAQVAP